MRLESIRSRVSIRAALTGAVLTLAWLALPRAAHAVTLTWGTSGTGGAGTWTNADAWWDGSQQTWNNATPDDAVFGGTGGAVALAGGTTTVGGITFNTFTGSYTIGTASQTLAINGGVTLNSGAGAVTIQNSPITLGAAQTWTNNSSSLLTVSSAVTNGGNLLSVDGSGNTTLSGSIAGTGGITKTGNGTLTLSGVNTSYAGTTTVNGGLLTSNTATSGVGLSSFGTGPIVIGSSGTVQLTGSNGGTSSGLFLNYYGSGYTNTVSGSGTLQLVGQSSGFSVNYSGDLSGFTGTVSATAGANTYVGYGSSTNASLNLTGSTAKFVVSGAGQFLGVLGATGTIALGELSGNGSINGNLNYATTWEVGGLSTSSTFSGRIANNTINSLASNLRKVGSGTLTLSGSNSYTGATTVVAGVLQLGSEAALSAGTGVTVAGGVLDMQSLNETVGSVTLTSGSIIGTGTLTAATYSLGGGSLGVPLGAGTLNVTGNSSLNVTAAATTVNLNSGTLTLGSGSRFTSSLVAVTGSGGGGLVLGGNETFGSLGGAARIALGSNTLSVGGANTSGTYSGIMSGAGNLTKDGTGALTLSGTNTYSGTTTINGGLLTSPNNAGGNTVGLTSFGSSALVIGSSGTARLTGWNGQVSAAAYYNNGYTNTVSGSGTLQLVGQGSNMSVNYSGDLSAFTGTVSATAAAGTYVGFGSTTSPSQNVSGSNTKFVVSGAGAFVGVLGASGTIAFGELSGNASITSNFTNSTAWEIGALSTSSTFSGGFSNNNTGISSLRKVGSGTLTLSGSSSFTGGTQLVAGGLVLGSANALGAATSPLAVNGGTLDLAGQSITVGLLTGSASGTITSSTAGAVTFTASSASSGTYAGSIADGLGTVAFAKAGSGTLALSGSNTYTGATTISAGRLSLVGNGVLGSGSYAGAIANAGELSVGSDVPQILSGAISGTGSLTKTGSGTLTLSGSNSFTGGSRINAGTVALGSADAIGSSGTISFGGGTLQFSSGNTTDYSSRFSTAASQAFNFDTNGQTVTLATGLSSTGGSLTKLGSGTLAVSGSNSYTGATTISAGVLQIGTGGTTGSLATASPVSVSSGAALAFNRSDALTYGGTVSGAGSLVKLGSNTLTLSATNTFSGGATISDGLVIGSRLTSFGTGTISLGASGTARLTAAASGTGGIAVAPAYYTNGYTNAVSGSGVLQLVSGASTYSVNYSGDLSGFTGTVLATTGSNQYTGIGNTGNPALNLTGSNAKFVISGAWGSNGFLSVLGATGTIALGELSGDGTMFGNPNYDTTWEIGGLATSSTFSGRMANSTNGAKTVALRKVGSGTLTLTGSSLFSAGTQLNAGTLVIGHAAALGTGTVTLGGGLLQSAVAGTVANPIAIAVASGTFDSQSNANTLSGAISGTGSFVKVGSGTLTLSASNSFTGTTRIAAGTLIAGTAAALSASTLDMNAADAGTITFSQNSTLGGLTGSRDLDMATRTLSIGNNGQSTTYSGVLSNGGLTKVGSGTLTLTGSNAYAGNTTISAGRLALTGNGVLNSGSYAGSIALTNPAELFVGSNANQVLSGAISGIGSLIKDSSSTLTLAGVNTYSGTTTVNTGLLASGQNVSSFGSSAITIGASGTVQMTGSNGQGGAALYYSNGYTNPISGSGVLLLVGQSSGYSVNYSGNLSGFTGIVSTTAAVGTYVGIGNTSFESVRLSGSNTRFVVSGSGALLPITGTTGVTLATIALGELSGNGVISSKFGVDSTWQVGGLSTSSTFSGRFTDNLNSGVGKTSLTKVGNGTLTLTGSNSHTGLTTVDAGTLRLNAASALGNGSPVTITNGTLDVNVAQSAGLVTLSGTGTILGAAALTGTSFAITTAADTSTISATLAGSNAPLVKTGAGGLVLTANNTFTGTATIGEGFVTVSSLPNRGIASPLGSGTTIALGASTTTGTLRYTGSGETTNRVFTLSGTTGSGGAIEANGSGALVLTGSITAAAGNKTLSLLGSNTGTNSIGAINDAPSLGGVTSLVKAGVGRWVLTGLGNYTGSTTIEQGELVLAVNATGNNTNGALGANGNAAVTLGSLAGTGTAALLLRQGVTVDTRQWTIPGGSQATIIGAIDGSGTATFGSTGFAKITLGRDTSLQAATGGTLVLRNEWAQASGTNVNITVGSVGNEGTVLLGQPLAATGTVRIDRGILSLVTKDPAGDPIAGSLTAASAVVVGPAGSLNAVLNVGSSGTSGAYVFGSGQSLSGIGTIRLDADTPVSVAGFFSPGNSPGIFTFDGANTTTLAGTTFMEITGTTAGTSYDQVRFINGASLDYGSGSLLLDLAGIYADNTQFKLFDFAPTASGSFTSISGSGSYGLLSFVRGTNGVWTSGSTSQANQTFTFTESTGTLVVVPEPATLALAAVGIGLGGWAALRRRK